jgi:hypothetical protein
MHRFVALAAVCLGVCFAGTASAEKSVIHTTIKGHDIEVVVHGVTDYCSTNADTEIIRRGDTIRIVRDRPSRVSRCMSSRDIALTIHDVPSGAYHVTYEQIPLVAPARALTLASTTAIVE